MQICTARLKRGNLGSARWTETVAFAFCFDALSTESVTAWGLTNVSVQGCEQNGQLKSSSIIDLSDERMREVVFFALILELVYCNVASEN